MIINNIFLKLIRFYQLIISPLFPKSCRYNTSCSNYAAYNIKRFGLVLGGYYAICRLLSCHPFNKNIAEE